MKQGFTLIELLVVMMILTVIMGLIVPKGSKMLDAFERTVNKLEDKHTLSQEVSKAFLGANEKFIDILDKNYYISSKGVLTEYEKINDNN